MELIQQLYDKYPALTPKQQEIADFLLANPRDACYISLKELSRQTRSSEVSVLRTCAALGFDGFTQLKEAFRASSLNMGRALPLPPVALPEEGPGGGVAGARVLQEIFQEESVHLNDFLTSLHMDDLFAEAATLTAASEVFIFGHDVSKVFADYIFHRLTFLRIKASSIMLGDGSTVQSMLARVKPGDHAIFLSFPPYHLPAITSAKYADRQGATVTVITDSADSPAIIKGCRHFICDTSTRFFYNSHTIVMSLVNLIASCVAINMGKDYQQILLSEKAVEGYMRADEDNGRYNAEEEQDDQTL